MSVCGVATIDGINLTPAGRSIMLTPGFHFSPVVPLTKRLSRSLTFDTHSRRRRFSGNLSQADFALADSQGSACNWTRGAKAARVPATLRFNIQGGKWKYRPVYFIERIGRARPAS